jgi:hypothetical protein
MSDKPQTPEQQAPELEREERRLERLRLVTNVWPQVEGYDDDPDPKAAA